MQFLKSLKALNWSLKSPFLSWKRSFLVQLHNPDSRINSPTNWVYDEINSITLGANTTIGPFSEIIVLSKPGSNGIKADLRVGEWVAIGSNANIRAGGSISIGSYTIIAQQVSLIASSHLIASDKPYRFLPWDKSKLGIVIGKNVWIGANVTILPGCQIGDNSVIGAGSVVTKIVPPNEIWVGAPARKVRDINVEYNQEMALAN